MNVEPQNNIEQFYIVYEYTVFVFYCSKVTDTYYYYFNFYGVNGCFFRTFTRKHCKCVGFFYCAPEREITPTPAAKTQGERGTCFVVLRFKDKAFWTNTTPVLTCVCNM